MAKHTPWGEAHTTTRLADGVTLYTTAGHGGIELSAEALERMPAALRAISTYAGPGWYEEDCDVALVTLAFPDLFPAVTVFQAVRMASAGAGWPDGGKVAEWLASPEGATVRTLADDFKRANGHLYLRGSLSTNGRDGWHANFRRIDGQFTASVASLTTAEVCEPEPVDVERLYGPRAIVTPAT